MEVYDSYTRQEARRSKGYDARMAERLLNNHPTYHRVDFVRRGNGKILAAPAAGVIQYIKATGGKYGRSAEVRHGCNLSDSEPLVEAMRIVKIERGDA